MKKTILLLLFIGLISCKQKSYDKTIKVLKEEPKVLNENNKVIDNTIDIDSTSIDLVDSSIKTRANEKYIDILVTTHAYRDWEGENDTNILTKNWIDLHEKDGKYYLSKANYKIQRFVDECSGSNASVINSKNNTLLLINKPDLKLGEVKSIAIKKKHIWPNKKVTYNFNNIKYTLRAEGEIISPEKEQLYGDNIKNYKLYFSTNNSTETLFLEEPSFNGTFVELLFVGDIDNDGKLDLIFSASTDYEEERVLLFLSSKEKNGSIIKKAGEIVIQFDC